MQVPLISGIFISLSGFLPAAKTVDLVALGAQVACTSGSLSNFIKLKLQALNKGTSKFAFCGNVLNVLAGKMSAHLGQESWGIRRRNKKPATMCGPESLADYQYRTLRVTHYSRGVRAQQVGGDVRSV